MPVTDGCSNDMPAVDGGDGKSIRYCVNGRLVTEPCPAGFTVGQGSRGAYCQPPASVIDNDPAKCSSVGATRCSAAGVHQVCDKDGEWVVSETDGYDFKGLEGVGYIYHWDTREGEKEYILRVPIERFKDLIYDYLHGEGRRAMEEYEEWEYKDGVYTATRIV